MKQFKALKNKCTRIMKERKIKLELKFILKSKFANYNDVS